MGFKISCGMAISSLSVKSIANLADGTQLNAPDVFMWCLLAIMFARS